MRAAAASLSRKFCCSGAFIYFRFGGTWGRRRVWRIITRSARGEVPEFGRAWPSRKDRRAEETCATRGSRLIRRCSFSSSSFCIFGAHRQWVTDFSDLFILHAELQMIQVKFLLCVCVPLHARARSPFLNSWWSVITNSEGFFLAFTIFLWIQPQVPSWSWGRLISAARGSWPASIRVSHLALIKEREPSPAQGNSAGTSTAPDACKTEPHRLRHVHKQIPPSSRYQLDDKLSTRILTKTGCGFKKAKVAVWWSIVSMSQTHLSACGCLVVSFYYSFFSAAPQCSEGQQPPSVSLSSLVRNTLIISLFF